MIMSKLKRKKSGQITQQLTLASLPSRGSRVVQAPVSVAFRISVSRHAFLHGVGSLGNVSGGYDRLEDYMSGDYVSDMRGDWMRVGQCLRESMMAFK